MDGAWEHDHAFCCANDGMIVAHIELERLTRIKHDNQIGKKLTNIISKYKLPTPDSIITANTFDDEDFFDLSRSAFSSPDHQFYMKPMAEMKKLNSEFNEAKCCWNGHPVIGGYISHELAHVCSCLPFVGEFNEESMLLHVDGAASLSSNSVWTHNDGSIDLVHSGADLRKKVLNYSINPLTLAILGHSSHQHLSVPGKLMGYAAYGHNDGQLHDLLRNHDFFMDSKSVLDDFSKACKKELGIIIDRIDARDQFMMDVAACIQREFEDGILSYLEEWKNETGSRHLYYAGGSALNIKANSRIINELGFESVDIPPCCSDCGLSLGAAAYMQYKRLGFLKRHSPFINNIGLDKYEYKPKFDIGAVCELLIDGKVIGICTGDAEVGPRALGHRSIIAIPDSEEIRDKVSIRMKKREWYRPLAPIVLERNKLKLFEESYISRCERFMLQEFMIKQSVKKKIAGVAHIDGSARAQIVSEDDIDLVLIVEILREMDEVYDVPCLINTSFNESGKPMVHTKEDAMIAGRELGLDAMILGNELMVRQF